MNCIKHPKRKAVFKWRICAHGPWEGVCKECDLFLNLTALKWRFPNGWKRRYETYKKSVMGT